MDSTDGAVYGRFKPLHPDRKEAPKVPVDQLDLEEVAEEYECDHCGLLHSSVEEAFDCCPRYHCPSCGTEYRYQEEADECCMYRCEHCDSLHDYESDALDCCGNQFHGEMPYLAAVDNPYRVEVKELPNRPVRLCSLEQELASGGAMVARLLYDIGVADDYDVLSYHSGSSSRGRAHVEEDGSLPAEGGEVVFDRFNLADHPEGMSLALTKIRQLRDTPGRPVTTSYAAGIHIHISAKAEDGSGFDPRDVSALYELWCYAEDMLYSFSAAGWQRHRQPADSYSGYCKPVPKDGTEASPRKVWQMMNRDRYYGLNFQRLFAAVERCSCGAARMGDWSSCDCGAFDRATVEWRVFNSSTLPRTIHAWLIFSHAMTAYATQHTLGTLPQNPYGSTSREEKREVLEHLLEILPLTDGERDVIREAAGRSPGL